MGMQSMRIILLLLMYTTSAIHAQCFDAVCMGAILVAMTHTLHCMARMDGARCSTMYWQYVKEGKQLECCGVVRWLGSLRLYLSLGVCFCAIRFALNWCCSSTVFVYMSVFRFYVLPSTVSSPLACTRSSKYTLSLSVSVRIVTRQIL